MENPLKPLWLRILLLACVPATGSYAEPAAAQSPYVTLASPEAITLYNALATNTVERFSLKNAYLEVMIRAAAVKMDQHPALSSYRFPATLGVAPELDAQGLLGSRPRLRARSGKSYSLTLRDTSYLNLLIAIARISGNHLTIGEQAIAINNTPGTGSHHPTRTFVHVDLDVATDLINIPHRGGVQLASRAPSSRGIASGLQAMGIPFSGSAPVIYDPNQQTLQVRASSDHLDMIETILNTLDPPGESARILKTAWITVPAITALTPREALAVLMQAKVEGLEGKTGPLSHYIDAILPVSETPDTSKISLPPGRPPLDLALKLFCKEAGWRFVLKDRQVFFVKGPLKEIEANTAAFPVKGRLGARLRKTTDIRPLLAAENIHLPEGSQLRYIPHAHTLFVRTNAHMLPDIEAWTLREK